MKTYLARLKDILTNGYKKTSRTGIDTRAVFGRMVRYDLSGNKIPMVTTKKIFFNTFVKETIWFISGSTKIRYLKEHGIKIWDSWVKPGTEEYDDDGNLIDGSIGEGAYGYMWRGIEDTRLVANSEIEEYIAKGFKVVLKGHGMTAVTREIDQLANVVDLLRNDPDSRRIIINSFENRMVDFAVLIACHCYVQFFSRELTLEERLSVYDGNKEEYQGKLIGSGFYPVDSAKGFDENLNQSLNRLGVPKRALKLMLVMRSNDGPVGEPFNASQYALLTHMVASVTDHVAEELIYVNGDYHVYENQIELLEEQLQRVPFEQTVTVKLNSNVKEIEDFTFEDIEILGYNNFHPSIKYPVAV